MSKPKPQIELYVMEDSAQPAKDAGVAPAAYQPEPARGAAPGGVSPAAAAIKPDGGPAPLGDAKSRHNSILMMDHAQALDHKPRTASGHDIHPHFADNTLPHRAPKWSDRLSEEPSREVNFQLGAGNSSSNLLSRASPRAPSRLHLSPDVHAAAPGSPDSPQSPSGGRLGSLSLDPLAPQPGEPGDSFSTAPNSALEGGAFGGAFGAGSAGAAGGAPAASGTAAGAAGATGAGVGSGAGAGAVAGASGAVASGAEGRSRTASPAAAGRAGKQPRSDPRIPQDDGKLHILIGVTGSLHVNSLKPIIHKLRDIYGDRVAIQVILTKAAEKMLHPNELPSDVQIWHDSDEWDTWKNRNDPVVHIELRRWADLLLVAPLSANTLGKIAIGLCDNLLTNVIRAWNAQYPVVVAPAMVSYAYNHPATRWHLKTIKDEMKWIEVLRPTEKFVGSYGGIGLGGMMPWSEIVDKVVMKLGGYPDDDEDEDDDEEDKGGKDNGEVDEDDDDDDDDSAAAVV